MTENRSGKAAREPAPSNLEREERIADFGRFQVCDFRPPPGSLLPNYPPAPIPIILSRRNLFSNP
jgi:hypothetical protein